VAGGDADRAKRFLRRCLSQPDARAGGGLQEWRGHCSACCAGVAHGDGLAGCENGPGCTCADARSNCAACADRDRCRDAHSTSNSHADADGNCVGDASADESADRYACPDRDVAILRRAGEPVARRVGDRRRGDLAAGRRLGRTLGPPRQAVMRLVITKTSGQPLWLPASQNRSWRPPEPPGPPPPSGAQARAGCPGGRRLCRDNHPPATPGKAQGLTCRYDTLTATTLCARTARRGRVAARLGR